MMLLRSLVVLLAALSFTGCAYLHSLDSNLPEKIDRWVEEKKYRTAINTLKHIKPDNKNYDLLMKKQEKILRLSNKLEKKTITTARTLASNNEWYKASLLYEDSLEKLPDTKTLEKSYSRFLKQRQAYLQKLETKLLVNKGSWLADNETIYLRIKSALPEGYDSIAGVNDYEKDRERALEALIGCAKTSSHEGRISLARTCLSLADSIDDSLKNAPELAEVRKKIGIAKEVRLQSFKQQTEELLASLRKGYTIDNLQHSHDHLQQSNQHEPLDREARELLETLGAHLNKGIEQRMEAARQLYSNGRIEPALQIWESLQTIAPDNQKLLSYIERAQRVLNKLQKLQELQEGNSVISPPEM